MRELGCLLENAKEMYREKQWCHMGARAHKYNCAELHSRINNPHLLRDVCGSGWPQLHLDAQNSDIIFN